MNVKLADNAGFCFGVKRAVEEAIKVRDQFNKKIHTLGPLIHNNDVVNYLKERDIYPIDMKEIDTLSSGDVIIIRSHGVSEKILNTLKSKEITVINTTCPYVSNIQLKVKKHYELGYTIIIVGDQYHPEVVGINGWCNDSAIICKNGDELLDIPRKVCVVSQTTEKQENWQSVLNKIIIYSKEIVAFNTICNATEVRQKEAEEIAKNVDVMVVIGGYNSSNTTKLYEICKKNCNNTIHVENAGEIPVDIVKNAKTIGVTAGASTPEWIIKEAISKMEVNKGLESNEQLQFMDQNKNEVVVGRKIKGAVISVNEKAVYVNIGYKADGLLPKEEISKDENVNIKDLFKIGEEIEAKVISRRNEDGYVVLSTRELEREQSYRFIKQAFENKDTIKVTVKEIVNGGIVSSYKGVRVFIPASHIELFHVSNLQGYLGKELDVNIIEFNEEKRNTKIVGSRREILKVEKDKVEDTAWNSISTGDTIIGEVRRLADFGAFIDLNGIDGLLHVSEISWGKVNKASDVLTVGEKVKVYVLDANKESKRISLSMKKLIENPWNNVDEKYPVNTVVLGKVVRFANFGAFVELEPGIDGLVHISQISNKRVNKPSDVLNINDQVKAKILEVDKENKKIGLSIKDVEEI